MRRLTNSLTKSTAAFRRRLSPLCLNIAIATALTVCGAPSVEADYPEGDKVATAESGSVFDFFTFDKKDPAPQDSVQQAAAPSGGLSVNAVLWQASLETLSFMPLASADPIGGVIISDWYNDPAATNERVKVNLIISGLELRADALRVSLFRETLRGGKWVATATSVAAARQLENIVLTRARDLAVSRRAAR